MIGSLPPGDDRFPMRWSVIKAAFSKLYAAAGGAEGRVTRSRRARGEVGVWQRRFWDHVVRSDHEHEVLVDYIH
jgi:putative transposase